MEDSQTKKMYQYFKTNVVAILIMPHIKQAESPALAILRTGSRDERSLTLVNLACDLRLNRRKG